MPYGIFSTAMSGVTEANPWVTNTWCSAWLLIKVAVPASQFDLGTLAAVVLYLNPPLPLGLMFKIPDRTKDCCCRNYYKHANVVTSVKAYVKCYVIINYLNFVSTSEELLRSSALLPFLLHTLQFLWLFACLLFLDLDFEYILIYRCCVQWRCGWNFDSTESKNYAQWMSYDAKGITSQRCKIMTITAYCQTSDI